MLNVVEDIEEDWMWKETLNEEMDWLKSVCVSNIDTCSSWYKHHFVKILSDTLIPILYSVMPPINKKVASVEAQYIRHD